MANKAFAQIIDARPSRTTPPLEFVVKVDFFDDSNTQGTSFQVDYAVDVESSASPRTIERAIVDVVVANSMIAGFPLTEKDVYVSALT